MIFLLRKNKNFQILKIFFYFGPPLFGHWSRYQKSPLTVLRTFCYVSLQNKCRTVDPNRQNLGRSGKLSFFIIYKFWQNCASVRQVSNLILKTVMCNHCENIMPPLRTIIEIQHFPCLKIVKFCTLSNRSMKFPTSGKNDVNNKTIYCGTPRKKKSQKC